MLDIMYKKIVDVVNPPLEGIPEGILAGSRGEDHLTLTRTEWIQGWFAVFVTVHLLIFLHP